MRMEPIPAIPESGVGTYQGVRKGQDQKGEKGEKDQGNEAFGCCRYYARKRHARLLWCSCILIFYEKI